MAKKKSLSPTFMGYDCKGPGCAGHKAGYRYARGGGGIPSPHSRSFNEGIDAYVAKATAPVRRTTKNTIKKVPVGRAIATGAAIGVGIAVLKPDDGNNTP